MHIPRGDNRLAQLIGKLYHLAVKVLYNLLACDLAEAVGYNSPRLLVLFVGCHRFPHHKGVVAEGLNFKVVVIVGYP